MCDFGRDREDITQGKFKERLLLGKDIKGFSMNLVELAAIIFARNIPVINLICGIAKEKN